MQLGDLLCYALITIAVTISCVKAEEENHKESRLVSKLRKISKRDASLLIDNFPVELSYNQKPKVIYRRVSRNRYGLPKSKYDPHRPKYGVPPPKRKPTKKYKKQTGYKYGQPPRLRTPKPRYGPPNRPFKKPVYGPPKKVPPPYNTEPAGFAEPPVDIETQHPPHSHHQNYAEPPVDSYGAPLKAPNDIYPPSQNYEESQNHYEHSDTNLAQEYNPWQHFQREANLDNSFAYSKKRPLFVKPDELFDALLDGGNDDENISDLYNIHKYKEPQYLHYNKKKPQFFIDSNKKVNKHWKAPKYKRQKVREVEDEILVGGQYAEPPARYVPKFQPSAPMITGSEEFTPRIKMENGGYGEFHAPTTLPTISPYVNYINSNMAFSPQNLNDAFSSR